VHALEALGYRETDLHLLAERLGRHETVVKHQDAESEPDAELQAPEP
jgi:hypothetical protein